ncbi:MULTISPECIES: hypothetical protein [Calditerrivibrio]|uniref:hypothetical protein n=1 Tax=Calditerrivibrio TaxID=545865 RepID=UPI003C77F019
MKRFSFFILFIYITVLLYGCSTVSNSSNFNLKKNEKFYVANFKNNTETYLAGERASNITKSLLLAKGFNIVNASESSISEEKYDFEKIKQMAKKSDATLLVFGEVNEWRYKTGIDGEPAVGLTISIYDIDKGVVVWTGVGAKSGWGHESITTIAQKLINDIINMK